MKTTSPNLDFWDEPLPVAGLRRLLRVGAAARHARLAPSATARRRLRRVGSASFRPVARRLRRSGRR